MVLVVPKAFILNSLLDSKLSDSLFIINPFIMYVISINVKKYQKCCNCYHYHQLVPFSVFNESIISLKEQAKKGTSQKGNKPWVKNIQAKGVTLQFRDPSEEGF